jgi:hypothetical protein
MTRILAIDPGIDAMGIVEYDLESYNNRTDTESLGWALTRVRTFRTPATDSIVARIGSLCGAIRSSAAAGTGKLWRIYVEEPAKTGTYRRNREAGANGDAISGPMSKLYIVIGAIISTGQMLDAEIMLVPAPRIPKDQRQLLAKAIFQASRSKTEYLERYGNRLPSADALDAIWLGAQQLSGDIAFDRRRLGLGAGAPRA